MTAVSGDVPILVASPSLTSPGLSTIPGRRMKALREYTVSPDGQSHSLTSAATKKITFRLGQKTISQLSLSTKVLIAQTGGSSVLYPELGPPIQRIRALLGSVEVLDVDEANLAAFLAATYARSTDWAAAEGLKNNFGTIAERQARHTYGSALTPKYVFDLSLISDFFSQTIPLEKETLVIEIYLTAPDRWVLADGTVPVVTFTDFRLEHLTHTMAAKGNGLRESVVPIKGEPTITRFNNWRYNQLASMGASATSYEQTLNSGYSNTLGFIACMRDASAFSTITTVDRNVDTEYSTSLKYSFRIQGERLPNPEQVDVADEAYEAIAEAKSAMLILDHRRPWMEAGTANFTVDGTSTAAAFNDDRFVMGCALLDPHAHNHGSLTPHVVGGGLDTTLSASSDTLRIEKTAVATVYQIDLFTLYETIIDWSTSPPTVRT